MRSAASSAASSKFRCGAPPPPTPPSARAARFGGLPSPAYHPAAAPVRARARRAAVRSVTGRQRVARRLPVPWPVRAASARGVELGRAEGLAPRCAWEACRRRAGARRRCAAVCPWVRWRLGCTTALRRPGVCLADGGTADRAARARGLRGRGFAGPRPRPVVGRATHTQRSRGACLVPRAC
jgi:hypothetical protein